MTLYFLGLLACSDTSLPKDFYYTELPEDTSTGTDSEEDDSGDEETDDTATQAQWLSFKTTNISCENLSKYQLSFTQLIPGGLEPSADDDDDVTNDLLAVFEYERWRYSYSDLENIEKDSNNLDEGCYFQISLPTAAPENLKNISTSGEDEVDVSADAPKWAFYYITLISKEKVSCSDPSATDSQQACSLVAQAPSTPLSTSEADPELEDGDFYVWASSTLLSYTQGTLSPSLQDMG